MGTCGKPRVTALLAGMVGPAPLYFGYLMSGLVVMNLVLGYQNWIVTYATADRRPIYVGLFNTISAVVTLFVPFISGSIVQHLGYRPLFIVSLMMALSALFVTLRFVHSTQAEEPREVTLGVSPV